MEKSRPLVNHVRGRGEVPCRFHTDRKYWQCVERCPTSPNDHRIGSETLSVSPQLPTAMSERDSVDPETVEHVASLARIDLDDSEMERFADQFADILDHFETLDAVPDMDVEPDLTNVFRPDEEEACLDREDALGNAPETEDGKFKGPRVS